MLLLRTALPLPPPRFRAASSPCVHLWPLRPKALLRFRFGEGRTAAAARRRLRSPRRFSRLSSSSFPALPPCSLLPRSPVAQPFEERRRRRLASPGAGGPQGWGLQSAERPREANEKADERPARKTFELRIRTTAREMFKRTRKICACFGVDGFRRNPSAPSGSVRRVEGRRYPSRSSGEESQRMEAQRKKEERWQTRRRRKGAIDRAVAKEQDGS